MGSQADAVPDDSLIAVRSETWSAGMTSDSPTNATTSTTMVTDPVPSPPRLRLKPTAPRTGYVDGGWWPCSKDLTTELPALAEALTARLGALTRISYSTSAWNLAPRRLDIAGYSVRLQEFHGQDPHLLHVSGTSRERITLLLVATDSDEATAAEALTAAAQEGNAERPEAILLTSHRIPEPRSAGNGEQDRWETEGGQLHQGA